MNEVKGWTIFGCCFFVCVVIVIISNLTYSHRKDALIARMAEAGVDPVAASVALDNIYDDKAMSYYLGQTVMQGR